ncbi:MAG: hypothetical protein OXF88_22400 [Rhodobacteraceae bacterium]|nr:hypothetical protein [Paracoccaceae bacterium]
MTANDYEEKKERVARAAKKGGRIGSRLVGGMAAPAAVYTLAASFGTASTGTAISTLSGAAATKATLAWLGGGAVAAGGLGIAGGGIVLAATTVAGAYAAKKVYDQVMTTKD